MRSYLHNRFHLPRKPLIRKTLKGIYTAFSGLLIIALIPTPTLKPIGIIPVIWAMVYWHYWLLPKWNHTVEVANKSLKVGSTSYPWETLHSLKLEHHGSRRSLLMVFIERGRRYDLILKDDIMDFEELAQQCFWHANDFPGFSTQSNSGSKTSTADTRTDG